MLDHRMCFDKERVIFELITVTFECFNCVLLHNTYTYWSCLVLSLNVCF